MKQLTDNEKKALAVGAIIALIILIWLLRRSKSSPNGASNLNLPTASIPSSQAPNDNVNLSPVFTKKFYPISVTAPPVNITKNETVAKYPPANTCGCSGNNLDGGLVATTLALAKLYTSELGPLLTSYMNQSLAFAKVHALPGQNFVVASSEGPQ